MKLINKQLIWSVRILLGADFSHIDWLSAGPELARIGEHQKAITQLLTLTMLREDSAEDKLMRFFLFFPDNRIWHFMQIVSCCMKYQSYFLGKNKKNISNCCLMKFLPSILSANTLSTLHKIFSRPHFDLFSLYIPEKRDLTFLAYCLLTMA